MNPLPVLLSAAILVIGAHGLRSYETPHSNAFVSVSVPTRRANSTTLGIQGTSFTVKGKPTFLLGISYYGALGASEATWKADLDQMQRYGFNWLRVWANWDAYENDVSAVDGGGRAREPC